jgi:DNA segregation ATPase FtsK/SpoIIIE-like protein
VDGDHPRAFTGLAMAFRLVRILGLRRSGRMARLVQRASVPATRMHEERRQFLRYRGRMLLTLLGSSILAACGGTTSSAPSPTSPSTTKVSGEVVARDLTAHTWVGLSTNG